MAEVALKRINKFLSEVGYCSRREADKLIDAGRVTINGVIPEMGTKITADDVVAVNGVEITNTKTSFVYLAFNKPVGIVCTTDTSVEKDNIIERKVNGEDKRSKKIYIVKEIKEKLKKYTPSGRGSKSAPKSVMPNDSELNILISVGTKGIVTVPSPLGIVISINGFVTAGDTG